jgi:hypothetical protein
MILSLPAMLGEFPKGGPYRRAAAARSRRRPHDVVDGLSPHRQPLAEFAEGSGFADAGRARRRAVEDGGGQCDQVLPAGPQAQRRLKGGLGYSESLLSASWRNEMWHAGPFSRERLIRETRTSDYIKSIEETNVTILIRSSDCIRKKLRRSCTIPQWMYKNHLLASYEATR